MSDIKDTIRNKIAEVGKLREDDWMKNTIILEDGAHLSLCDKSSIDDESSALINEIFDLVDGDQELRRLMYEELEAHADEGDYRKRREEALGWKPGMTVGTPDVPQEVVDEYIGKTFSCPKCGVNE